MGQELLKIKGSDVNIDLCIGTITHNGEIRAKTQKCLDQAIRYMHSKGYTMAMRRETGSLIPLSRNRIAEMAVEISAKCLIFVDADMVFAEDAMEKLLKHDRDIISGLCTQRAAPYMPVAKMRTKEGGYLVAEGVGSGRLIEVDGIGSAFVCIKPRVFEALNQPYYAIPAVNSMQDYVEAIEDIKTVLASYTDTRETLINRLKDTLLKHQGKPKNRSLVGEDYFFCEKARMEGFKIFVDTSLHIGHLGEKPYCYDDYLEYKKYRDAQKDIPKDAEAVNAVT